MYRQTRPKARRSDRRHTRVLKAVCQIVAMRVGTPTSPKSMCCASPPNFSQKQLPYIHRNKQRIPVQMLRGWGGLRGGEVREGSLPRLRGASRTSRFRPAATRQSTPPREHQQHQPGPASPRRGIKTSPRRGPEKMLQKTVSENVRIF